jgi:hypothetical protein
MTADAPGRTSFGWRHRLGRALVVLLLLVTCAPVPADERLSGIFDGTLDPKSINDLTADFDGELDGLLTISRSPGHALAPALHPFSLTATLTQRAQIPPDHRPA